MKEFIDKLIERLEEKESQWGDTYSLSSGFDEYANGMSDGFEEAIKNVNELAEEYKGGWIPVSERLPEYTDEYNVTVDAASEFGCYRTVKTFRFERIEGKEPKWVIPQDEVYRVIAWMPLPAPYTEGE